MRRQPSWFPDFRRGTWRRFVVALLIAAFGIYGALPLLAPPAAATALEICRGPGGETDSGAADPIHTAGFTCLLCLPGCAALAAAEHAPEALVLPQAEAPEALLADSAPAQRAYLAHAPRGPPA